MSRTLLCVDMSYQLYRAAAAHPMLTSRRIFTGGIYGFYTALSKCLRETGATDIAFGLDVKPYKRSEVYPEYKQIRKKAMDEDLKMMFSQSKKLVLESFEESGLQAWGIEGFEFDDLVAHCVGKYRHRYERIYAFSNDSDLWQLLWCDNFRIYTKDFASLVSRKTLDLMGITPEQYMLSTALTGTHNDVAGIVGVGPVTAIKAVKDPALMRKQREKHAELIDRNLSLIKLPHAEFPRSAAIPKHESFSPRRLYSFLGRLDIDITPAMSNAMTQIKDHS